MPVLRDITAKLGLQLDKKSFKLADTKLDQLQGSLKSLQGAAIGVALAGAGVGLLKLTTLASDANETLNVLDLAFESQSKTVQNWATTFGAAAGRSRFKLMEMAGTLGSVLNPLMGKNAEAAASMSKGLTELAVDLGSLFNKSDDMALQSLLAGITGEGESLKRNFGVVMTEATLQAFALAKGIKTQVKAMSIAEKTQLRYNFFIEQTTLAQGDAIRTSKGWANATKGLGGSLRDLGTEAGLVFLPFAEKIVLATRDLVVNFGKWAQKSNLIKAALMVLGAIAVGLGVALTIAFAGPLLVAAKFAAVVALVTLFLDDFLTFMEGGDSIIGRFIESIFGPGSATAAAEGLKAAWAAVVTFWNDSAKPALKSLGKVLVSMIKTGIADFKKFFATVRNGFGNLLKFIKPFTDAVGDAIAALSKLLGLNDSVAGARKVATPFKPGQSAPAPGTSAVEAALGGAASSASIPAPGGGRVNNTLGGVIIQNSTKVEVQGDASERTAGRIADRTEASQNRVNRRSLEALTQEALGP